MAGNTQIWLYKSRIAVLKAREQIKNILKSQKGNFEVFSWEDMAGTFLIISELKANRIGIFILVMLIIASMGIINTMLMAVLERTREIGMLGAMGMKKSEIKRLFIWEGGLIGVMGSLLGCILGGLGGWYLEVKGLEIFSWTDSVREIISSFYPLKNVFYGDLTVELVLMTFILGTVVSIIASFYPAAKAARLNPIDALRYI